MDFAAVLSAHYRDASWQVRGDQSDYASVRWFDDSPMPSEDVLRAAWPALKEARDAQHEQHDAARASALAKLQALGLTEAEALALVGGTP
jgi:hypothetical protein